MIRKCKNFDVKIKIVYFEFLFFWNGYHGNNKKTIWWPPFFILPMYSEFLNYPLCEILSNFYFQFLRYEMRSYRFKMIDLFNVQLTLCPVYVHVPLQNSIILMSLKQSMYILNTMSHIYVLQTFTWSFAIADDADLSDWNYFIYTVRFDGDRWD